MNWHLTLGDGSARDIVYWPELTNLDDFFKTRGGNPILFPFSARTFDCGDIHFWRAADGVRRPMPMHGIARQSDFAITRLDATGFTAQLTPNAESRACYPYEFEFNVTYRFAALGLTCEFALTNHGHEPHPVERRPSFLFHRALERRDHPRQLPDSHSRHQTLQTRLRHWPTSPRSTLNLDRVALQSRPRRHPAHRA